jgi:hypothetical protein
MRADILKERVPTMTVGRLESCHRVGGSSQDAAYAAHRAEDKYSHTIHKKQQLPTSVHEQIDTQLAVMTNFTRGCNRVFTSREQLDVGKLGSVFAEATKGGASEGHRSGEGMWEGWPSSAKHLADLPGLKAVNPSCTTSFYLMMVV